MTAWAKPGVKCVCVRKTPWRQLMGEPVVAVHHPEYLGEYTITGIYDGEGHTWLFLSGFPDSQVYHVKNFRPLVPEADDLELFRHHLNTVEEPA